MRMLKTAKNLNNFGHKKIPQLDDVSLTKKMTEKLWHIKARCNLKNKNKFYTKRGIKCFLTVEQMKYLWIRCDAHLLESPCIDRINPEGHYEVENCRFIEVRHNSMRATKPNVIEKKNCKKCFKEFETVYKSKVYCSQQCTKMYLVYIQQGS